MVSYKKWQASKKGIFKYCFQSKVASCKSKSRELLAMGNMSSRKLLIHIKIYQQLIEMCFFFVFFFLLLTCQQVCGALKWDKTFRANGLPPRSHWPVSVISFRRVFVVLVTRNRKTGVETSEQREETAAASSLASEWLSSGFVSVAALQSSHSLWVWNLQEELIYLI